MAKTTGGTGRSKAVPVIPILKARQAAQTSIQKGTKPTPSKGRVPGRALARPATPAKSWDQWNNAYQADADRWIAKGGKTTGRWGGGPPPPMPWVTPEQLRPRKGFSPRSDSGGGLGPPPPPKGFKKKVTT